MAYTLPSGTTAVPGQRILAARYNAFINSVATALNLRRESTELQPTQYGGTNKDTSETSGQPEVQGGTWYFPQNHVNVKTFGAVGDGVADDTAAIQSAIDDALYISKCGTVILPAGTYKTTDTLHFGYGVDYGGRQFQTGRMIGAGIDPYDGGVAGTTIKPTFSDRPCIAISGAWNVYFSDFTLFGLNDIYPELMSFDMAVEANWIKAGLHANADSRYAPYAGIAMDPYKGVAPGVPYPDVTFPAFLGAPAQYGKTVSSMTHFNRLRITQFVVGVVASPSGGTYNNDFIKIDHCMIGGNKYNISICEANNRNLNVSGGQINAAWKSLVNNVHGAQQGYVNCHFNEVSFDWCYQIVDLNMAWAGPCKFTACYSEGFVTIGNIYDTGGVASPVTFEACHFFASNAATEAASTGEPLHHLWGNSASVGYAPVKLEGCSLGTRYTFNSNINLLSVDNSLFNMWNTAWKTGASPGGKAAHASGGIFPNWLRSSLNERAPFLEGYWQGAHSPDADVYGGTDIQRWNPSQTHPWSHAPQGRGVCLSAWSPLVTSYGEAVLDLQYAINTTGFTFNRNGADITFDDGALIVAGEFTEMLIGVGDLVFEPDTQLRFYISSITNGFTLIQLNSYKINGGVFTTQTVGPVAGGGGMIVFPSRFYHCPWPIWGDLSIGSPDITNVGDGTGAFPGAGMPVAGDYLVSHTSYCKGTRNLFTTAGNQAVKVVTVTSGTNTIVVNRNAAVTQARVPLNLWIRKST